MSNVEDSQPENICSSALLEVVSGFELSELEFALSKPCLELVITGLFQSSSGVGRNAAPSSGC